jgi:hypothetical protein
MAGMSTVNGNNGATKPIKVKFGLIGSLALISALDLALYPLNGTSGFYLTSS